MFYGKAIEPGTMVNHRPVVAPRLEQRAEATQKLAELIGAEEANKETWQSRLVWNQDGELALAVKRPFPLRGPVADIESCPWASYDDPTAFQWEFPALAQAVKLLRSKANPELILIERRKLIDAHEAELARKRTADRDMLARQAGGTIEQKIAANQDRERFAPSAWKNLPGETKVLLSLAHVFEDDSKMAGALAQLARESYSPGGIGCPSREWWRDIGLHLT